MIFWDSSAVVPLLVAESQSAAALDLAASSGMVVWWGTPVELESAIARREREGLLPGAGRARVLLAELSGAWVEVLPSEDVRTESRRLVRVHPLRAADATQLAAALVWCARRPGGVALATLDASLATAAEREGFTLPLSCAAPPRDP